MNPLPDNDAAAEYTAVLNDVPDDARLDRFEIWLADVKSINWREAYPGAVLSLVYELYRAEYANHVLVDGIVAANMWGFGDEGLRNPRRWSIEGLDS